jgi:hypothetical protein
MSHSETREIVRSNNAKALQELLTAIDKFNDDYDKDPNNVDMFIDSIEEGRNIEMHFLLQSINRQRVSNKIFNELAWHFSYHTMYMSVADLARRDSIINANPETKQVWWQRYLDMVNHAELRESRDRWQHRYLKVKAIMKRDREERVNGRRGWRVL